MWHMITSSMPSRISSHAPEPGHACVGDRPGDAGCCRRNDGVTWSDCFGVWFKMSQVKMIGRWIVLTRHPHYLDKLWQSMVEFMVNWALSRSSQLIWEKTNECHGDSQPTRHGPRTPWVRRSLPRALSDCHPKAPIGAAPPLGTTAEVTHARKNIQYHV